jgi:hypothetical protein
MTTPIIGTKPTTIAVANKRARTAPKPVSTFNEVLRGSAQVLLAGAEMATSVVGGSVLSAALARTREKLATRSQTVNAGSAATASGSGPLSSSGSGASTGNEEYDALKRLQDESRSMNTFFLQLQQKMQQENRRFTTVSNIMKARHDTARSAINNIRS